jgi:1-acyl-sn-glycerol-3-phosphate acyltransferase
VVPVVTRGLRNICPAKEWRIRPGVVDVIFGAPIETHVDDDPEELARRTREAMNELLLRG